MASEQKQAEQPKAPIATPSLSGEPETLTERQGSGPHYIVRHTVVGRYTRDSLVPAEHFGDKENLQRLVDLGAIERYDRDDPDARRLPTLSEALRSDSPPTLPVYAGIDTTPEEVRHAVSMDDTFAGGPLPDEPRLPENDEQRVVRRGRARE